ncbi:MAG: type transport system ATP-binding protein [Nocardioidaceae bacterium]|nr:type transport system ATP-binding protein [Nocardioidaceae bacterium]
MTTLAVEVTDLVMRYGDKTAVDGLSLTVEPGGVTAVLGPNGAGKTTTIETCEGYRRPQSGAVRVLGLDPRTQHRELAPRVGVMLQAGGSWSAARATEMLTYMASLYANPLAVDALVDRLGLAGCGRTPYRRLSGGQQQRLGVAMAIVGRPELVFLDEPTAGLDPQARRATWDLVEQLAREGVTVVLTTHYIEEAERLAGQVHVLDHGRVMASGSPAELTSAGAGRTIRFRAAAGLDVAALTASLPAGCTVTAQPGGAYSVSGSVSPQTLAAVTSWCAARGVMPEGLTVGHATLEDVFLDLTGRELRA